MASQGPNFTANWTGSAIGIQPWITPTRAQFSDDLYTSSAMIEGTGSDLLVGRDWGFTIPASATIDGVLVEIERKMVQTNPPDSDCEDALVQLWRNNILGAGGDDKANYALPWPEIDTFASYGGAADLWGLAAFLTPATVNGVQFGIAFAAQSFVKDLVAQVDCIRMTVFYTDASGGASGFLMGVW